MAEVDSGSPAFHTVTDPRQAALLTDPRAQRFLEPFLARTRSVKEAADEAGCAVDTMLYRVRVFRAAGLLEIVGRRQRAGRAVTLYRTAHDAYFVPYGVTPFATVEERLLAAFAPVTRRAARLIARQIAARGGDGVRLRRDEHGQVWATGGADLESPARPPGFDFSTTVYLSETEARAVQETLSGLLETHRPNEAEERRPYLLSAFFVADEE